MKDEIERVSKLKSDDPSAYGKWKADYSDKAKTKKYKTKVSPATKVSNQSSALRDHSLWKIIASCDPSLARRSPTSMLILHQPLLLCSDL